MDRLEFDKYYKKLQAELANYEKESDIVKKLRLCFLMSGYCNILKYSDNYTQAEHSFINQTQGYIEAKIIVHTVEIESGISGYDFLHTKIVGVSYDNDDGTPRQELIANLQEFDKLDLVADEYDGDPAIRVEYDYETLGFLNSSLAKDLICIVNEERIEMALVKEVTGSEASSVGCNILIVYK